VCWWSADNNPHIQELITGWKCGELHTLSGLPLREEIWVESVKYDMAYGDMWEGK
jgi:hypothetical protein